MLREEVLIRSSRKIATYIENYVTRAGVEDRETVLGLFESIHQLFPQWVITTCSLLHPGIHYISMNAPNVFGYSREYLIDNSNIEKYLFHVHEDDQEELHDCISFMHDHLQSVSPEDHSKYRAIFHYRYQRADGAFIYLHDEKAILNVPGSGNLYYTLFRDITAERVFTGVKVELFKQEQQLMRIKEYQPSSTRKALSKREKELVTLIRQGLSTKEIAGVLHISPNTARNIKSKLFEKYNVNNSIELLNLTA